MKQKKIRLIVYCSLIFIIVLFNNLYAHWTQTNGPVGGQFDLVTSSGSNVYIQSHKFNFWMPFVHYEPSVLYYSSNSGENWFVRNTDSLLIYSVYADGNVVYAATETGIYKSSNSGVNWVPIGLQNSRIVGCAADGNTIFAYEAAGLFIPTISIYRSTNAGQNWTLSNTLGGFNAKLKLRGSNVIFYGQSFFYTSSNLGDTWNPHSYSVYSGTVNSEYIFANVDSSGSPNRKILRTSNSGVNWEEVYSGLNLDEISCFGNKVYLNTNSDNGFLYSVDNGQTFTTVSNIFQNENLVMSADNGFMYACDSKGIHLSNDNGYGWYDRNNGIYMLTITSFVNENNTIYGAGSDGFFKSENQGNSWDRVNLPYDRSFNNFFYSAENNIYAVTRQKFYKSINYGQTWDSVDNQWNVSSIVQKGNILFCSKGFQIMFSTNFGNSWSQFGSDLSPFEGYTLHLQGNYLFAAGGTGKLFRSRADYPDWMQIQFPYYTISDIESAGSLLFASGYNGIFKSSDNGINWIKCSGTSVFEAYSLHRIGNKIFTGTRSGVLISTDFGLNWNQCNEGLTYLEVPAMISDENNIYIGVDRHSVFKRSLNTFPSINYDIGITSLIEPKLDSLYNFNCVNNLIMPKVNIANFGLINQSSLIVNIEIKQGNNIIYQDSKSDVINSGEVHTVNFSPFSVDIEIFNQQKTYNVTSWLNIADDNPTNDTLRSTFKAINPNYGFSDASGYYFLNSSTAASCIPEQPAYNWEDTTGSVSLIVNAQPVIPYTQYNSFYFCGSFRLPDVLPNGRKFKLFGTCYDTIIIANNGVIGFGNASLSRMNTPFPDAIPSVNAPRPAIFPLWYWVNFQDPEITGRNLKYKITDDKFIITYDRVPLYNAVIDANDYATYQVVLETDVDCSSENGRIKVQYNYERCGSTFINHYNNNALNELTVGIQNSSGTIALQYRRSEASHTVTVPGPLFGSPLAVEFAPVNSVLPVDLQTLTSSVNKNNVILHWSVNSELNNSGFEIQRKTSGSDWIKINFINGRGSSFEPYNYSYEDKNLYAGKYEYRLKQIDYNGSYKYYDLQNEVVIGIPEKFRLGQNYPNPFNPVTKIDFDLPVNSKITLIVYDVSGREVRKLMNEIKEAGYYSIEFNGTNLASGVYFYKLEAGKFIETKRMILLK